MPQYGIAVLHLNSEFQAAHVCQDSLAILSDENVEYLDIKMAHVPIVNFFNCLSDVQEYSSSYWFGKSSIDPLINHKVGEILELAVLHKDDMLHDGWIGSIYHFHVLQQVLDFEDIWTISKLPIDDIEAHIFESIVLLRLFHRILFRVESFGSQVFVCQEIPHFVHAAS